MTVEMALDLGRAVGSIVGPGNFAVSRDSRFGGGMFVHAVASGLLSTGSTVIHIGPAPTPTLQFLIPRLDCVGGVMITASHNPPEFNGIKVMGSNGIEVNREVETQIEASYSKKDFAAAEWRNVGVYRKYDGAIRTYLDAIKFHVNVEEIENQNLRVVVDCANSVGSLATPQLLRELGCKVFSLNAQLDGKFPGRDPEPTPSNLSYLSQIVKSVGADIGIAHDGDADRATFVDENGNVLWGDQSFAIVASHVLSMKKGSILVTPVSSGRLIEDVANAAGAEIDWTVVGSVQVSHRLEEIGAVLGGEENGGIFYTPHQPVRDGAMTAAQVLEIMAIENKKLSELASELPRYFSTKVKVPVDPERTKDVMKSLLKLSEGQNRVTIDGVKLICDDGWFLVRPSGTEPLWRCFSEASTQESADELAKRGEALLKEAIARV